MSIYIYLYLSISIYIYLYLSISIYIYLYLSISIYIYLYLSISISIYIYLYLSISIYLSIRAYLDPLGPSSDLSQWLILAQHLHGVDLSRRFLRHLKDLSETATAQPWFSTNSMDSRQQQLTIGEPSVGSVFLKKKRENSSIFSGTLVI